jgi:hypothetical protein
MTEEERLAWGAQEHRTRIGDIAAVKRGEISLEEAQKRARKRQRDSGLTKAGAHRAMIEGNRADRRSPQASESAENGNG